MAFVVYEMDPIGVDGALEAVTAHPYCSAACQAKHTIEAPVTLGEQSSSSFEGLVCETCGKPIPIDPVEKPRVCPFCAGTNVVWDMVEWSARSTEPCDPDNTATLDEHQCLDCNGRSFWT